MIVKFFTKRKD